MPTIYMLSEDHSYEKEEHRTTAQAETAAGEHICFSDTIRVFIEFDDGTVEVLRDDG